MLIKAERTGRRTFGDKAAPTDSAATIAGVKITIHQCDTWSSGQHPGDGEYIRCTYISAPPVDPWPNLKGPTAAALRAREEHA